MPTFTLGSESPQSGRKSVHVGTHNMQPHANLLIARNSLMVYLSHVAAKVCEGVCCDQQNLRCVIEGGKLPRHLTSAMEKDPVQSLLYFKTYYDKIL